MKNVKCNGGEATIQECPWSDPDSDCASHLSDSIVYCTNRKPDEAVAEGTLRLLGATGAPSLDGVGRVEIYQDGDWGPVCSDSWATGSEAVACRAMGFSGVARSLVGTSCTSLDGVDYCGTAAPTLTSVACAGSEASLLDCQHRGASEARRERMAARRARGFEASGMVGIALARMLWSAEVFCAPADAVVIACQGAGQPRAEVVRWNLFRGSRARCKLFVQVTRRAPRRWSLSSCGRATACATDREALARRRGAIRFILLGLFRRALSWGVGAIDLRAEDSLPRADRNGLPCTSRLLLASRERRGARGVRQRAAPGRGAVPPAAPQGDGWAPVRRGVRAGRADLHGVQRDADPGRRRWEGVVPGSAAGRSHGGRSDSRANLGPLEGQAGAWRCYLEPQLIDPSSGQPRWSALAESGLRGAGVSLAR